MACMKTMDGFGDAVVGFTASEGNELDAWLQRYRVLRGSLFGVAEPPADYGVVRPKLYLETTIPSILTSRPSGDLLKARIQQTTRAWWDIQRSRYDIWISRLVLHEANKGDPDAAKQRSEVLAPFALLRDNERTDALAAQLLTECGLPARAEADATHIAIAAVHSIDFLLTWNCTHLANAALLPKIMHICNGAGYACPKICTPTQLLERDRHDYSN
jgi:hypothetical protein